VVRTQPLSEPRQATTAQKLTKEPAQLPNMPFWLVDVANACVVVHFLGAYQVIAQPVFARLEAYVGGRWPESRLVTASYELRLRVPAWTSAPPTAVTLSPARMALRAAVIVATTAVAAMMPFFNAVLGFIAALGFWPLAVYLPVSMHIARVKIRRGEARWWALQGASAALLVVPSPVASRTEPGRGTPITRYGPSHIGESLLNPARVWTRRRTRSSTQSDRARTWR